MLSLLTNCASDKAIGLTPGISPRTVQTQLERIYMNLGVETRTGCGLGVTLTLTFWAPTSTLPSAMILHTLLRQGY